MFAPDRTRVIGSVRGWNSAHALRISMCRLACFGLPERTCEDLGRRVPVAFASCCSQVETCMYRQLRTTGHLSWVECWSEQIATMLSPQQTVPPKVDVKQDRNGVVGIAPDATTYCAVQACVTRLSTPPWSSARFLSYRIDLIANSRQPRVEGPSAVSQPRLPSQ
jgi:hypothetical protein